LEKVRRRGKKVNYQVRQIPYEGKGKRLMLKEGKEGIEGGGKEDLSMESRGGGKGP